MLNKLDLRGTPCPVNFVRCRLALEQLHHNQKLQVDLDKGEPEQMVILGLEKEGHDIKIVLDETTWLRLLITPNAS